ncbi:MAG: hypothetical protein ABIR17_09260 [Pseudolysinimonas sp.]|uniref:hypothetical protein n=1 Tax=Pseudolysinimonas sp. TaxID=2680009 RepID=UPI0032638F9C
MTQQKSDPMRRRPSRGIFGSPQGTVVIAVLGVALVGYGLFTFLTASGAAPTPTHSVSPAP